MASTSLSRTCTGSLPDSARYKFTFSGWFKLSGLTTSAYVFNAYYNGNFRAFVAFDTDQLVFKNFNAGVLGASLITSAVYRDTNAWYHVVVTGDTTQATASDRLKMWVNGEQITSFASTTYPSQNTGFELGTGGGAWTHYVGSGAGGDYFDGLMTHVHYVEGTAYSASDFGETDSTTGIWKPKTSPSVTYNVNSWFLKFENAGTIGTDSSGQGNNFSVASGSVVQTIDTPSNVFATLNPLNVNRWDNTANYSQGNLYFNSGNGKGYGFSTLGVTKGKWYVECKLATSSSIAFQFGVADMNAVNAFTIPWYDNSPSYAIGIQQNGTITYNNTATAYGNSLVDGDILSLALDMDNYAFYIAKNGVWQNSGDPTSGASKTGDVTTTASYNFLNSGEPMFIMFTDTSTVGHGTCYMNFGNGYFGTTAVASGNADGNGLGIFEYAPPTGFLALCTKNINAQEYA